jgi:hypothetical protein
MSSSIFFIVVVLSFAARAVVNVVRSAHAPLLGAKKKSFLSGERRRGRLGVGITKTPVK